MPPSSCKGKSIISKSERYRSEENSTGSLRCHCLHPGDKGAYFFWRQEILGIGFNKFFFAAQLLLTGCYARILAPVGMYSCRVIRKVPSVFCSRSIRPRSSPPQPACETTTL